MIGAEIVGGVESLAPSGAPNDVWRRNNDPNTRLFFDSSEPRDANEPVLWKLGGFTFDQIFTKKIFLKSFFLFREIWLPELINFKIKAFQKQKIRATGCSRSEQRRTKSDSETNPVTKLGGKVIEFSFHHQKISKN